MLKTDYENQIQLLKDNYENQIFLLNNEVSKREQQIAEMRKDHSSKQVAAQRQFEEWQKAITAQNFAQVTKLQTELSLLVKVKAGEIQ